MGLIFQGILILFSHVQFSFEKDLSYSACWTQIPNPLSSKLFHASSMYYMDTILLFHNLKISIDLYFINSSTIFI